MSVICHAMTAEICWTEEIPTGSFFEIQGWASPQGKPSATCSRIY